VPAATTRLMTTTRRRVGAFAASWHTPVHRRRAWLAYRGRVDV